MNISELRAKTKLSQRAFSDRLGLSAQSIVNYEQGKNVPESVQKLIRYEFAEYLPDEERLAVATAAHPTQAQISLQELNAENEQLKKRIADLEQDKEDLRKDKEMLQLHIKTLTGNAGKNEQTA